MDEIRSAPVRTPLIVLTVAAAVVVLRAGAAVFGPVMLSVLLAYALEPGVAALVRLRFPRFFAACTVYAVLAIACWITLAAAAHQINAFVDDLPRTTAEMRARLTAPSGSHERDGLIAHVKHAADEVERMVTRTPPPDHEIKRVAPVAPAFDIRRTVLSTGSHLLGLGTQLIIVSLLTFLLLATGDLYRRKMLKLAGRRWEDRKITLDVIRTIDQQIERYLGVRLLISVIVAVLTAVGLFWLDVSHALVWGAVAGALNVVPFIGPTVACALITAAALFQFQSLEMTMAAGAVSVGVAALEGNLITPWLTSRAGELNTVAVFLAVVFWGWLWDVWGLLLAIPLTVALKAAADHIEPLQPVAELLGR